MKEASFWQPVPSTCLPQEPCSTLPLLSHHPPHSDSKDGASLLCPHQPCAHQQSTVSTQDHPLKLCLRLSIHFPSSHCTCPTTPSASLATTCLTLPLPGRQAQVSSSFCSKILNNAHSSVRHSALRPLVSSFFLIRLLLSKLPCIFLCRDMESCNSLSLHPKFPLHSLISLLRSKWLNCSLFKLNMHLSPSPDPSSQPTNIKASVILTPFLWPYIPYPFMFHLPLLTPCVIFPPTYAAAALSSTELLQFLFLDRQSRVGLKRKLEAQTAWVRPFLTTLGARLLLSVPQLPHL